MKIRTRLTIAFCIILFVPLIMIFAGFIFLKFMSPNTNETFGHFQQELSALSIDTIVSVSLILILTAIIMVLWIYKGFVPQIKKLTKAADRIKKGDLDFTISGDGDDELSELCNAFEEMRARLRYSAEEKLEAEEEQRMLISNIAHDLKTPITSIKGYSEGLLDGVATTKEKQANYVKTIYNKAIAMDNLINELTLYCNLDTNRIPYNFQKINVREYFVDCATDIGMDLANNRIKLDFVNYVSEDVMMIADPEQISRVINNLINNSVKYMGKKEALIKLEIHDDGDFVRVDVSDNGKGIDRKDLPYIFDRTFRGDESRHSDAGGSGIGLSIVKKIVEDHGGKIWAKSTKDVGTTMTFILRKII